MLGFLLATCANDLKAHYALRTLNLKLQTLNENN